MDSRHSPSAAFSAGTIEGMTPSMHRANGLKRSALAVLLTTGVWAVGGCQEEITATLDGDLVPVDAVTVDVTLPFSEFARDLEGWGGYGRPHELSQDIVARSFEGSLDARVLNGFYPYPVYATVKDSTGVFVADSALTFVGGRVVVRFDTISAVHDGPVEIAVGALPREWDYRSVGWDVAVDSVGDRQLWDEAGAGPVIPLGTVIWDPAEGDSAVIEVDSAHIALFADTAAAEAGVRLDVVTEGARLDLAGMTYQLDTRPSVHPDTLVTLFVTNRWRSFIYDPVPDPPAGEIRVGGVPAWRSVFTFEMPDSLYGPTELCEAVGCPLALTGQSLISASLILTSRAPPAAFQPVDSLFMDVRPVLEPSRLPKSPLGSSLLLTGGVLLAPEDFQGEAGAEIEIPLGSYVEGLILEKTDPDLDIPKTLALLSSFEPLSLYFGAFEGPDSPDGPKLRLILTFADEIGIR